MYKSPIEMFYNNMYDQLHKQIMKKQESAVYEAVVRCGVNVDKEELIRALKYDRQQYDRGYADGQADAMASIVRCKDCNHYRNHPNGLCYAWTEPCTNERGYKGDEHCVEPDDFCSYGERREADV